MTAISTISETERRLLKILGQSLKFCDNNFEMSDLSAEEWEQVYLLADRHEVSVLLSDVLNPDSLAEKIQDDFSLKQQEPSVIY